MADTKIDDKADSNLAQEQTQVQRQFYPNEFMKNFDIELEEDITTFKIKYGKYEFLLLNIDEIAKLHKSGDKWMIGDIFKINFYVIVAQLRKYFINSMIRMEIDYDCASRIDEMILGEDAYVKLNALVTFEKNNRKYECGFDYITDDLIEESRKIKNLMHMDYYDYYFDDSNNFKIFMEKSILKILIVICSITNDEYKLAKITFINNFKNDADFEDDYKIFNKIINGKKNGHFNLAGWFEYLKIVDRETNKEMSLNKFKEICEECLIARKIRMNVELEDIIEFSMFENILAVLDISLSDKIYNYRLVYCKAVELLILSLKDIVNLTNEINKKVNYIPQYLNNFINIDIKMLHDKSLNNAK